MKKNQIAIPSLAALLEAQQELMGLINAKMAEELEAGDADLDEATMLEIANLIEKKTDNVGFVLNQLMPQQEEALKRQAEMFAQAAKLQRKSIERMKAYIVQIMGDHQLKQLEGNTTRLRLQNSPVAVDPGSIEPEDMAGKTHNGEPVVHTVIKYEWDKAVLKQMIADGDAPTEMRLVQNQHLRIEPRKI